MAFDRTLPFNALPALPPAEEVETVPVLRATIRARSLLSELKGYCLTLPHPEILLNTVVLQESRDSSAIENIVTTQDELYRAVASPEGSTAAPPQVKEVLRYREAIYAGMREMERTQGVSTAVMVQIMRTLKQTTDGVRTTPGTKLANPSTREIIYTPPEGEGVIRDKLQALEGFVNDELPYDPLVVMALMHYQFEAIHPFSDGNGRTGRILNVLFLLNRDLLTLPVLYLSGYIVRHKADYYRLLRRVTEEGAWTEWVLYMLDAVAETSQSTLETIKALLRLRDEALTGVKEALPRGPGRELVDLMFSFPYLKISTLETAGIAKRQAASAYLHALTAEGGGPALLSPLKVGREVYFINEPLMRLLSGPPGLSPTTR